MGVDKYSDSDGRDSSLAAVNDFLIRNYFAVFPLVIEYTFANFLTICLFYINYVLLPTSREGNVFRVVCHSAHNQPHDYSVTTHPCYGAVGTHPTGML